MALSRSLSTGASSLRAHQQRFDVISNNIANTNTTGYKSSRVLFSEQLKQNYSLGHSPSTTANQGTGGINPVQVGLGVRVGTISMNMGQGSLEQTGRPLDLAIQGEGFFTYNMNGTDYFSRAGAISIDREGNLVDSMTGAFLQGHPIDMNNGKVVRDSSGMNQISNKIGNLSINSSLTSPPKQTTSVKMSGNLNSSGTGNTRETSISIHDQRGVAHTLALTLTRNATNTNQYDITAKIDGNDVTLTNASVTFKPDGTLDTTAGLSLDIPTSALNTALGTNNDSFDTTAPNDNVNIVFGDANNLLSGLTHYSGSNTAIMSEQDGFSEGTLSDVSVDNEGRLIGAYSNGESMVLGQVLIAKFANPGGLERGQGNYFAVSANSGEAIMGAAGEEFPSTSIASNSLEASNVDMTEQFTDMITTQRAYEAAARTITVSDQMLSETNMLKR